MLSCCSEKADYKEVQNKEILLRQQVIDELSKKEYKECEKNEIILLQKIGFSLQEDLEIKNVFLDKEQTQWIHTTITGNPKDENLKKNPPYVMIHGYGHNGLCFINILKELSKKRIVYTIDLYGMGLSHRPDFDIKGPEETIQFFVDSINKWSKALNLDKFILVGHSIGGYIAANYAMQNQEQILNLHLLSPIGATPCTKEENDQFEEQRIGNAGWSMKILYKTMLKPGWNNSETPESIGQKMLIPTGKFVQRYVDNRVTLDNNLKDTYRDFLYNMVHLKPSSSKCLHQMFRFPKLGPYISLQDELPKRYKDKPVHFYFGDKDWMNQKGVKEMVKDNVLPQLTNSQISNASHNLQFDNPSEVVAKMQENDDKTFKDQEQQQQE